MEKIEIFIQRHAGNLCNIRLICPEVSPKPSWPIFRQNMSCCTGELFLVGISPPHTRAEFVPISSEILSCIILIFFLAVTNTVPRIFSFIHHHTSFYFCSKFWNIWPLCINFPSFFFPTDSLPCLSKCLIAQCAHASSQFKQF